MAGFFTYLFPYGLSGPAVIPPEESGGVSGVIGAVLEQETIVTCFGSALVTYTLDAVIGTVAIEDTVLSIPFGVCLLDSAQSVVSGAAVT